MSDESDALLSRAQSVGIGASAFMLLLTCGTAAAMWAALFRGLGVARLLQLSLLLTLLSLAPALEIAMLRRLARASSAWTSTVISTSACLLIALLGVFLPIFAWVMFAVLLSLTYAYELYVLLKLRRMLPANR